MKAALDALVKALGRARVLDDPATLELVNRSTFTETGAVVAIAKPMTVAEVQACVRIANTFQVALYPTSAGKNWGYGSRVPPRGSCVLLDLSGLKKISAHDTTLGTVTVQTGVTFMELHDFLEEQGSPFVMTAIGGPFGGSVLANMLERGIGKGPYADRFLHACAFEVVLPTGEAIKTGFGRFPNAVSASSHRWGVGPVLDGLFTQSNLGIVTEATVFLCPKSVHADTFIYWVEETERLGALVDGLRVLRLEGTVQSSVLLMNDVRQISIGGQYPWEEAQGKTPLTMDVRKKVRQMGAWSGEATIHAATAAQAAAHRARIVEVLAPRTSGLIFRSEETKPELRPLLDALHGLATGVPLPRTIATTYWRKKMNVPDDLNPDRDRCGVIFFSPAIPFEGAHVIKCVKMLEEIYLKHGFDPNIGINAPTERNADMTPMMLFDRDVPGEDERAHACQADLYSTFAAAGYYPYRLPTSSMDWLPEVPAYDDLLRKLKVSLDPNDVLAPGRYDRLRRK